MRPVPDYCEFVESINDKVVRCLLKPRFACIVNDLSPLYCCASHGKKMSAKWKPFLPYRSISLAA